MHRNNAGLLPPTQDAACQIVARRLNPLYKQAAETNNRLYESRLLTQNELRNATALLNRVLYQSLFSDVTVESLRFDQFHALIANQQTFEESQTTKKPAEKEDPKVTAYMNQSRNCIADLMKADELFDQLDESGEMHADDYAIEYEDYLNLKAKILLKLAGLDPAKHHMSEERPYTLKSVMDELNSYVTQQLPEMLKKTPHENSSEEELKPNFFEGSHINHTSSHWPMWMHSFKEPALTADEQAQLDAIKMDARERDEMEKEALKEKQPDAPTTGRRHSR